MSTSTYREYTVTVDNGYGGGTAAHGINYSNPLYTAEDAVRVATHPRNRELSPVIYTRTSALGEWRPVRVSYGDDGVLTLTPDYAAIDEPAPAVTPEPVSAREATRGTFPDAATLADYSASPSYSDRPLHEHASAYPASYTARYARKGN